MMMFGNVRAHFLGEKVSPGLVRVAIETWLASLSSDRLESLTESRRLYAIGLAPTEEVRDILIGSIANKKKVKAYLIDNREPVEVNPFTNRGIRATPQEALEQQGVTARIRKAERTHSCAALALVQPAWRPRDLDMLLLEQSPRSILAAMAMLRIGYPQLLNDALVLDKGMEEAALENLSTLGRAWVTTLRLVERGFQLDGHLDHLGVWNILTTAFVQAASGDSHSREVIEMMYDRGHRLLAQIDNEPLEPILDGKAMRTALIAEEARMAILRRVWKAGAAVAVLVGKSGDLIEAGFTEQYEVMVAPDFQDRIDLRRCLGDLVQHDRRTDRTSGIMVRTASWLIVSRKVFDSKVLPWLGSKLS